MTTTDETDAPGHAELAKANLLRLRGDADGAIAQCLSILKRAPEDLEAHLLVAEIHAERGDVESALQWYELALDLSPRDPAIRAKIAELRERAQAEETAAAAPELQLAVPVSRPPWGLYAAVGTVLLAIIGGGAYLAGQKRVAAGKAPLTITAPTVASDPTGDGEEPSIVAPPSVAAAEDETLARAISGRLPAGATLGNALQDPRTQIVTLTVGVSVEGTERALAAEAARAALGAALSAPNAVVRVVRGGALSLVATVERARLAETETSAWRAANPASDAWIEHVLGDVWPPRPANPPEGNPAGDATPPPTDGTTGGASSNSAGTVPNPTTGPAPGASGTP